ncbi:MAG: hypothetical protein KAS59_00490 [Alphaproteobacteria bacterium]|nr:hypothetical protein [Alphaproteobacteria bacterium]MCK5555825.1 hypothetical protein [Alphaproteobacteria bacterium]
MATGKHAKIKLGAFLASLVILVYAIKPGISSSIDCTADVKSCPDGSYVSRHGPQCEFSPCPREKIELNISNDSFAVPELILSD